MSCWKWIPVLCLLAACGVDGEPIPPGEEDEEETAAEEAPATKTSTSAVISVGSGGHGGVATTLNRGNVSITLGTGF